MAIVTPELTQRLNSIRQMIYRYSNNLTLAGITNDILMRSHNTHEPKTLFYWVQKNIHYKGDGLMDTLHSPIETIKNKAADCEDQVILLGSMLRYRRWPLRFKVIASIDPAQFNHIYLLVGQPKHNPQEWIPADTTIQEPYGSEPPVLDSYIIEV